MIIIFFDLGIVGIVVLFIMGVLGIEASSLFNALPNYMNLIALILVVLQTVKQFVLFKTMKTTNKESNKKLKRVIVLDLLFECIRCLTISITICKWLSSYSSNNFFESILTGIFFIIDILLYGLILMLSEGLVCKQIEMLVDGSYAGYLALGILNAVGLFFVIALATKGALVRAFKQWFMHFL